MPERDAGRMRTCDSCIGNISLITQLMTTPVRLSKGVTTSLSLLSKGDQRDIYLLQTRPALRLFTDISVYAR